MKIFTRHAFAALLVSLAVQQLKSQAVSTTAGDGTVGAPLNLDSALKAPIGKPSTIFIGKNKSFYYTDILNHQIRKVDSNGVSTTMAGNLTSGFSGDGGNALSASLSEPRSLVVTKKKEIVFCDHLNHRIRKIDSLGIITTIGGAGTATFTGDGGPAIQANFNKPRGIVQDKLGNFIICDESNNRLRKIDTNGNVTTIMGSLPGYSGDGGSAVFAQLNRPTSLSIDQWGRLFITDANNYCVRMIDTLGIVSTIAGNGTSFGFSGDGGSPLAASFLYISAVSVADNGDIVIADAGNNRIRRIRNGVVLTIAGNGIAGYSADGTLAPLVQFSVVAGIAMDKYRNVYICDQGNNRIRTLVDYNKITAGVNELKEDAPIVWWSASRLTCNSQVAGKIELFGLDGRLLHTEPVALGDNQFYIPAVSGIISYRFISTTNQVVRGKLLAD
jgi:hypothetical protein